MTQSGPVYAPTGTLGNGTQWYTALSVLWGRFGHTAKLRDHSWIYYLELLLVMIRGLYRVLLIKLRSVAHKTNAIPAVL